MTSGLNGSAARKDCAHTRIRREPIAHFTKASSRRCLVAHSPHQKIRDSGIRKLESLLSKEHRPHLQRSQNDKMGTRGL